ncbi:MAG: hypothetical protein Q4D98_14065 [Planctomycetia bacterium]|nr:hypothetical protein [Planctomycetia bacterium]
MTLKLLKKLQTTTRRTTVDLPGASGLFRFAAITAALVGMTGVGQVLADHPVRQAVYQENAAATSPVRLVSYESMATQGTSRTAVSSSGKALRWVSVSSPEAREIKRQPAMAIPTATSADRGIRLVSNEEPAEEPLVIPSVPGVGDEGTTSALELPDMDLGNVGDIEVPEVEMPALPETPALSGDNPSTGGGQKSGTIVEESTTTEPGAIGNTTEEIPVPKPRTSLPNTDPMEMPSSRLPIPESGIERPSDPLPGRPDGWQNFSRNIPQDNSCPKVRDMKRIDEITNDITAPDGNFPIDCPLAPANEAFPVRQFAGTHFTWTASNLCHNPLYFEQPAAERYGHSAGPILQPLLSGAEFILTVPCLPYLMALDPVNECQYALGYYRPGSCAPYKWNPVPFTLRAAIAEGGIWTGLVFLIP